MTTVLGLYFYWPRLVNLVVASRRTVPCPLTAVFLIAEITNGYELFIPLMIVSSLSFFIVKTYEPFSMETKILAMEGQIFTHKKEQNILTSIRLEEMLQDKYESIGMDKKLKELWRL